MARILGLFFFWVPWLLYLRIHTSKSSILCERLQKQQECVSIPVHVGKKELLFYLKKKQTKLTSLFYSREGLLVLCNNSIPIFSEQETIFWTLSFFIFFFLFFDGFFAPPPHLICGESKIDYHNRINLSGH